MVENIVLKTQDSGVWSTSAKGKRVCPENECTVPAR